jgi:hypothetical protein
MVAVTLTAMVRIAYPIRQAVLMKLIYETLH